MNKSQRRLSGKTALTSGQRMKVFVALMLTVITVGLFAFEPDNQSPAAEKQAHSPTSCNSIDIGDAAGTPLCTADASAADASQGIDLFSSDANNIESTDSYTNSSRDRHADSPRPWHSNRSNLHGPRPGYTMAELCSAGRQGDLPHCQTGSFDTKFNASASSAKPASPSGYSISGRVLAANEGGVSGVTIVASPERLKDTQENAAPGTLRFWTMTDTLGAYTLDGLPEGEYTIRSGTHGPYQSAHIAASTGVNYADLVLVRNSAAIVEGQVLTDTGEPLEGVTVLPVLLGQPSVLTDASGHFTLPVTLKPAIRSFALRLQRPGFSEQSTSVAIWNGAAENPNNAVDGASTIAAGKIVMHPVESWTALDGNVYSESGDLLAGRIVELRPRSAHQKYTTTTDVMGHYAFSIIESPAEYRLTVFGGTEHKDYQQNLKMKADTAELNVFLEPYEFGEVTGQVVNQNGVPVPRFDLVLRNISSQKPNIMVRTDQSGNFVIPAAPAGDLVIASQSAPSLLVQGIHLEPGDKMHLPLVLDWGEHEIHGSVVDTRGNPVPASRIVLQWSHQLDGVTTRATRRTAADTQGHFAFSNLGPGPHSLQIDAPGFPTVDIDHDLRRQGYDLTVRLN